MSEMSAKCPISGKRVSRSILFAKLKCVINKTGDNETIEYESRKLYNDGKHVTLLARTKAMPHKSIVEPKLCRRT